MIAMALACNPELLIADEPTTALDVTIQAQVIDLMLQLQSRYNAAIMMITHDLGVIAEIAQRVVVMYAGQVVETGDIYAIFESPMHPYTEALAAIHTQDRATAAARGAPVWKRSRASSPAFTICRAGCSFLPAMPEGHAGVSGQSRRPSRIWAATAMSAACCTKRKETRSISHAGRIAHRYRLERFISRSRSGFFSRIKGYVYAVDGVSLTLDTKAKPWVSSVRADAGKPPAGWRSSTLWNRPAARLNIREKTSRT